MSQHDDVIEAAAMVLKGFGAGIFVRNTENDHQADWAVKALPYITALGRLDVAVKRSARKDG